jgi:V-type H+-transporting ATPase subunit d
VIGLRATGKWVHEFKYFRASATGNLARFLDYVSYEYMIDNILVRAGGRGINERRTGDESACNLREGPGGSAYPWCSP